MDPTFWQHRWQQNQIGFHLDRVNPHLIRYWHDLQLPQNATVFVPLCGKSLDLIWLAQQGYHVIGVECSELAVQAFFQEQGLSWRRRRYKGFEVYNAENLTLLQGDYFDIDAEWLEDVAAVYDRASLVAMPADMRKQYAEKMCQCLPADCQMLLVTLDYNRQRMTGPPFSVGQDEVVQLYSGRFKSRCLCQDDILAKEARFRDRGLDFLLESVFHLQPA